MTDPTPPAAAPSATPPFVKDIPENNWLYRRLFAFFVVLAMVMLAGFATSKLVEAAPLKSIALAALGIVALMQFLYICGATAEEFMKLISIVRNNRVILSNGSDKTQ